MSAANIGISQLESLQLRDLLGPSGIGSFASTAAGFPHGGGIVQRISLTLQPNGTAVGNYNTSAVLPSGTGIMRVRVQVSCDNGSAILFGFTMGGISPTCIPSAVLGVEGWFYEGILTYNNASSTPFPVVLTVHTQGSVQVCNLIYLETNLISFGPYVQQ